MSVYCATAEICLCLLGRKYLGLNIRRRSSGNWNPSSGAIRHRYISWKLSNCKSIGKQSRPVDIANFPSLKRPSPEAINLVSNETHKPLILEKPWSRPNKTSKALFLFFTRRLSRKRFPDYRLCLELKFKCEPVLMTLLGISGCGLTLGQQA